MAKFLNTQDISAELIRIIRDAREKIILISPYLKVNQQVQERLKVQDKRNILESGITIICKSIEELKPSEIEWMNELVELKIFQKSDLHAKCYMNENTAIICSMNLYDYSQSNNKEMGILISRDTDPEAFKDLQEEINDMRTNSHKLEKIGNLLVKKEEIHDEKENSSESDITKLNFEQKRNYIFLKNWRALKSREIKKPAYVILTNKELEKIILSDPKTKEELNSNLSTKKINFLGKEIISELNFARTFTIVEIVNTIYKVNEGEYEQVVIKTLGKNNTVSMDTTKELPPKGKIVAARLNGNWFNEYYILGSPAQ